jgi:hypothetical protein
MALPKFNNVPEYSTTVPSTGASVKFRPFLTREQKVLLIALESQDGEQIIGAIANTITACTSLDVSKLTFYDLEYLFAQIRAKSVGEKSTIGVNCTDCDHLNKVVIDISSVEVVAEKTTAKVQLSDTVWVTLKHPPYNKLTRGAKGVTNQTELLMEVLIASIDSVQTEDENINMADESKQDIVDFVDQFTTAQLNSMLEFARTQPTMTKDIAFTCESCKTENTKTLRGIADFF